MSRITEKQISQLVKEVADLAGFSNNRTSAIAAGHESYLSFENAACYGGYRLIMVGVKNGAHYGAFGYSSTEPRLRPAIFAERLSGIIAGLQTVKVKKSVNILAKEWFDKANGNSYFAARVTINNVKVINIPFQYGYGDQYLTAVAHELQIGGFLPEGTIYTLPRFCRENNIDLSHRIERGCLKRDVLNLIK